MSLQRIDAILAAFNEGKPDEPVENSQHRFTHSRWDRNISIASGEEELGALLDRAAKAPDVHQFHRGTPEGGQVHVHGWTGR